MLREDHIHYTAHVLKNRLYLEALGLKTQTVCVHHDQTQALISLDISTLRGNTYIRVCVCVLG